MAHPYPYANSAQALYWPALGPRFFDGWNPSEARRDRDLLCAEMSRLAYAQREAVAAALSTIKFSLHGWIGGETAEQRAATRGTDGFIATSDGPGVSRHGIEQAGRPPRRRDGHLDTVAFTGFEPRQRPPRVRGHVCAGTR